MSRAYISEEMAQDIRDYYSNNDISMHQIADEFGVSYNTVRLIVNREGRWAKVLPSKLCAECGEMKTINKFAPDKKMPDGHKDTCSECSHENRSMYDDYRKDAALWRFVTTKQATQVMHD